MEKGVLEVRWTALIKPRQIECSGFFLLDQNGQTRVCRLVSSQPNKRLWRKRKIPMNVLKIDNIAIACPFFPVEAWLLNMKFSSHKNKLACKNVFRHITTVTRFWFIFYQKIICSIKNKYFDKIEYQKVYFCFMEHFSKDGVSSSKSRFVLGTLNNLADMTEEVLTTLTTKFLLSECILPSSLLADQPDHIL